MPLLVCFHQICSLSILFIKGPICFPGLCYVFTCNTMKYLILGWLIIINLALRCHFRTERPSTAVLGHRCSFYLVGAGYDCLSFELIKRRDVTRGQPIRPYGKTQVNPIKVFKYMQTYIFLATSVSRNCSFFILTSLN